MAISECENCGNIYHWNWEDAFDKFGFNDGEGQVETCTVSETLREAGYAVEETGWGLHNVVISSIKKGGLEQIPESAFVGYNNPREYLPVEITKLLDEKFPSTSSEGASS